MSEGKIVGIAVFVALVAGGATSYLQTALPFAVAPFANSAGSWCALAFVLASLAWRTVTGVVVGMLSLASLVAGYYWIAGFRGYGVNIAVLGSWFFASLIIGPILGTAAVKRRYGGRTARVVASFVLPVLLVAEGIYAYSEVGDSTSRGYWIAEIVVGVVLLGAFLTRSLTANTVAGRNT